MLRSHAIIEKISLQSWESFSLEKKEKRNKNRESRAWRDLHRIFELYAHISTHGSNALCKFSSSFGYFFLLLCSYLSTCQNISALESIMCVHWIAHMHLHRHKQCTIFVSYFCGFYRFATQLFSYVLPFFQGLPFWSDDKWMRLKYLMIPCETQHTKNT